MESEPAIKITGMTKLHPLDESKNFFKTKNFFDAEEIFFVAKQLRGLHAKQMLNLCFRSFSNDYYYRISGHFVTRDQTLLSTDNIYSLLTSEEGNDSLRGFLTSKTLDLLQDTYANFLQNSGEKRKSFYDVKEKLVDLLASDPMKLISPTRATVISEFLQTFLISFDKLRYENTYIEASSALGIKEPIVFHFMELKGLAPEAKPRFFKLTGNERQEFPGMQKPVETFHDFQNFFKTQKSVIYGRECILDMEDTTTVETLKEFICLNQKPSNLEFLLEPIGFDIRQNDFQGKLHSSDDEMKKFNVKWPNSLEGLKELFGQRGKSKFLTLKNGLELLERLEPSQKFIELMQGKKILLDLYSHSRFRNIMGTRLEAKALEVLILHLKLESVQVGDLMICKVQEKITEESLAYIWQRVEHKNHQWRNAMFSGYQLSE